jgi:uncharacterized membrane protein
MTTSKLLIIAILCTFLGACGGGDSNVQAYSTTQGQELMDLKKAFEEGVITEDEYNKARKRILKR